MKHTQTGLSGVFIIEPRVIKDNRGFFMECYVRRHFERLGVSVEFIQDNHSLSVAKGTVRGMHYQLPPEDQAKLVRVVRGEILNVIVDIRIGSPTYRRWEGVVLSAENRKMLFIPTGFANGYCTLAANTEVCYKVDRYYAPELDRAFRWNDPEIGIEWPVSDPVLSDRDRRAPAFADADNNFRYEAG
ncbi:MAG: dTDP-4-dehydrorhamnose 3,5-epimerase [Candidatus Zixiibacteriota bacterium]|nr:MAG: dTDP-4-dehydrorhamnose 3,5-epimerase [candidate division Zixibacteria bacterium]